MKTRRSEEMRGWFALGEENGWTIAEIAEAAGVARSTAAWWKRRLREEGRLNSAETEAFAELVPVDRANQEALGGQARAVISLPSGVRIEVQAEPGRIVDLVRRLEQC